MATIIVCAFIYKYVKKQLYAFLFVHLLLFSVLLYSISYLQLTQQNVPDYLYSFLIAVGVAAVGYHFIKIVKQIKQIK